MAPPPPQHSQSTIHNNPQTLQFLSNVLSQRGPSSLPYPEDVKWLIRQHLLSLTETYPSLQPKTAVFTHNDGRTVNLLQSDGTIPMSYCGVTYNIPVVIWLMEAYPRHPPCVFVNPTRDMIIKRPHPHVSPSGLVSIPYLHKWVYPSSNLLDLAAELSVYFGRDPPLYSQRKPETPSPSPSPSSSQVTPAQIHGHTHTSHSSGVGDWESSNSGYSSGGRVFPQSPYGRVMQQRTDDPNEVFKRNAINKLVEMVHGDVAALKKAKEAEMEGMFSAQAALRSREEVINNGLRNMLEKKEALEQQLQLVLTNADVLEGWLKENEEKMAKLGGGSSNVDVDDAFEPCDVLSKQMIEASAADLALEDVIYSLDKAVQDGVVPFDQYLKNVRLLSREQFFHRATFIKVRAAQMQAHVAGMAARTNSAEYMM